MTRWVTSIGRAHVGTGHPSPGVDPLVRATLAGIRRVNGNRPTRKRVLLLEDVRRPLGHLPPPGWPVGAARRRDHLLLLLTWVGAFRRSELISLDVGDVEGHSEDGLHIQLARSKTDPPAADNLRPSRTGRPR